MTSSPLVMDGAACMTSGLVSFDHATQIIADHAAPLGVEHVSLDQAAGRILAEDIVAQFDFPPSAVSAMDGYAVRDADLARLPAFLPVAGASFAGHPFASALPAGRCVRVFTGAAVPPGRTKPSRQRDCRDPGNVMAKMRSFRLWGLFGSMAIIQASSPALANTAILDAVTAGRPVIDLRARYESVDDASKNPTIGSAATLRARLGYETGTWNGLSLQADFDQIWLIAGNYNSSRNGKTSYPVIADPAMTALNRLQLTYASDYDTKLVVGRQRILIGNQRFVGNSGWRQHEQTFDALSAVNSSIPGLVATYTYIYRVNRVNGPDLPSPSNTPAAATGQASYFKSDSNILDVVYTGTAGLRLEGYAFLLDLAAPGYASLPVQQAATARLSTQTYGLRADYNFPMPDGMGAKLTGEFASQTPYASNPLSFNLDYYLAEASASYLGFKAMAGYEILAGNGTIGFATPLATLHMFNGWADMFLTTPTNGLKDLYFQAAYSLSAEPIGMKSFTPSVTHHTYATDHLNAGIGSEWDMQGELAVDANLALLAKYANYQGSGAALGGFADKSIVWLQTAWKY